MKNLIKEIKINTAEELFRELSITGKYKDLIGNFLFRGHEDRDWELIPSIFRENNLKLLFADEEKEDKYSLEGYHFLRVIREQGLVYEFYREASERALKIPRVETIEEYKRDEYRLMDKEVHKKVSIEWIDNVNMEEICALAQHYDIPTRLLDWTKDVNVAIYFAIQDIFNKTKKIYKTKKIVIWAFDFKKIKEYNLNCLEINKNIEIINSLKKRNAKWGQKIDCSEEQDIEEYNKKVAELNNVIKLEFFDKKEFDEENLTIYKDNLEIKKYNEKIKNDNSKELQKYKKFLIPIYSVDPLYYANPNINAQKGILLYQKTRYGTFEEVESLFNQKTVKDWENSEEYEIFKLPLDKLVKRYINEEFAKELGIESLFYKFVIPQKEVPNMMEYLYKLGYDAAKIFPGYYGVAKKILEQNKLYTVYNKEKNI